MSSAPIERTKVTFTRIAATFGGAQSVSYTKRFAWVKLANGTKVRIPRSKLPAVDKWSAFNLANAAKKELEAPAPQQSGHVIKDSTFVMPDVNEELLAACKGLMLHFVGERDSSTLVGDAGIAADAARVAIAKAEGGAA